MAPPFRQAEFDIMYGKGISREGSLLDVGIDLGIVKKSGAWFTYEGEQLGQGRENAKQFLTENLDLMVEISEKIKDAVGIDEVPVEAETEAGDADGSAEIDQRQRHGGSDFFQRQGQRALGQRQARQGSRRDLEVDR